MSWFADWHGVDLLRFHRAPHSMIMQPGFNNPDDMGRYMRWRVRIADDGKVNSLGWNIDELVRMADAVQDFLNVNRICNLTGASD